MTDLATRLRVVCVSCTCVCGGGACSVRVMTCSMYYSYMDWHLDFTRPQMIITIKLTTLAFNLSDAKHRAEEVIMTLDLTLRS